MQTETAPIGTQKWTAPFGMQRWTALPGAYATTLEGQVSGFGGACSLGRAALMAILLQLLATDLALEVAGPVFNPAINKNNPCWGRTVSGG
eukprot:317004-Chlamydomonas_euryale.AAC.3